ncbi:hypothetical protein LTR56_004339 [Elasticomyces elasticus]|nr:hypothetical protein LTR22_012067 [Elasticomyces elasticus]KAK3653927.1 hypothetical protein LTR56_004339 [Elasticomyces elasticus]KAK4917185.1 hypothetical protein LTR49_014950 [Elasticomyces elasticus]KAK5757085.1 hypothetical protein LTS12_012759 [Elasticomyces elasticus]
MRPDVHKANIESWIAHANRDRTVGKSQLRGFKTTVGMLADIHNETIDTNDPDRVVLLLEKGKITVPGFTTVNSRKRKTGTSESGSISKEVQPKKLMSVKDLKKAGRFDMLAKHHDTVTTNNDDDDGEDAEEAAEIDEDSRTTSSAHNTLGKTSAAGSLPSLRKRVPKGTAKGSSKSSTKADGRDRTPGNLLALGKMSDLPRNAEPQIDDQQAIRVIRDRGRALRYQHEGHSTGDNYNPASSRRAMSTPIFKTSKNAPVAQ